MSGIGGNDSSALRFSRTRGRTGGAADYGLQYPSPFFDIGHTYLPATVKQMFRWCRYYFLVNPLINAVVSKMSEYPITDIILDSDRPDLKNNWYGFLNNQLHYRAFQIELGLDFWAYGNALISIYYPFVKMLRCKSCGHEKPAADSAYRFLNFEFHWACEKCDTHAVAQVRDHYIKAPKGIRLLRWNPEDVDIRYNDISGEYEYYYSIPVQLKNDIIIGKKSTVETSPQLFIDALKLKKSVVFSRDNLYHFKRPTLAGKDRGWGTPLILPVLKDTFYLQILRKAQECVSPSTLIETTSGLVTADDVRIGDLVRTHTGQWHPVENKWYRDAREDEIGRQITLTGLRPMPSVYSPHHPVLTIRRNEENRRSDTKDSQRSMYILRNPHLYEEVLCPADQLEVGDYALYPRRLPANETIVDVAKYTGFTSTDNWVYSGCGPDTAAAFETLEEGGHVLHDNAGQVAKRALAEGRSPKRMIATKPMTPDLAYILGWYAGDGSCGSRHVTFSLGNQDDPARLISAIQREFDVGTTIEPRKSVNNVVLSDVIVRKLIKGLIPGSSNTKQAPREILDGLDTVKLEYLRGLWEADGYLGDSSGTLATSSREQAYDAYRMLLHLGCIASVRKVLPAVGNVDGREIRGTGSYHVYVCGQSFERFHDLLSGAEPKEVVSGKSGFFWKDYFATRICAVEEVEEQQYIDFKVAEDTTFCTPGTATKNSIAIEHIVPMRALFPQAGSATSDPYTTINLADWRDQIAAEIRRWRCVSPESLIETRDGLKPAGDVELGDWLKNRYGIFERVIKRHERPLDSGESAYKLRVRGQHAIDTVFSEEHPIWAARKINNGNGHKLGAPEFVRVDKLHVGDYVGYPIRREVVDAKQLDLSEYTDRAVTDNWVYIDHTSTEVPDAFEYLHAGGSLPRKQVLEDRGWGLNSYRCAQQAVNETRILRRVPRYLPFDEELAWVLGLYTAEGNCTPKAVFFSFNKAETEFVDRLDRFFLERFGANRTGGEKSENGIQIAYCSVIAAQVFASLVPGISRTKRLPECVRKAPAKLALAAIRGVLDGDGASYLDKAVLGVASRQLVEDVRQLLLSMQIMSGVSYEAGFATTICGKDTRGNGCYRLQISGDQYRKLVALLAGEAYEGPDNCRIGLFRDGFAWFRIEAIEEAQPETVVAFQMEGDSTFCTWGVATHNSDQNYIPILPLPIGQQTIGGDGRALLLSQEIRVWSEHIVAGMGIPVELIFGGLSYSGSNVSLRMLENMFLGYLSDQLALLRWVIERTSSYLGWAPVSARFKPFKMADDLQRKAYLFQLNQAGKLSDESLLADADYDSFKEDKIMENESSRRIGAMKKQRLLQAEMEGEANFVAMKWQSKIQTKQMAEQVAIQNEAAKDQMSFQANMQQTMAGQPPQQIPGMETAPRNPELLDVPKEVKSPLTLQSVQPVPSGSSGQDLAGKQNVDLLLLARQIADRVSRLTPAEKSVVMQRLSETSPELHDAVQGLVMSGLNGPSVASAAAARPLPMQRPPRRGPESALV